MDNSKPTETDLYLAGAFGFVLSHDRTSGRPSFTHPTGCAHIWPIYNDRAYTFSAQTAVLTKGKFTGHKSYSTYKEAFLGFAHLATIPESFGEALDLAETLGFIEPPEFDKEHLEPSEADALEQLAHQFLNNLGLKNHE